MAEYEPTLDDGELWLPSEIMADVGLRPHCPYHHRSSVPSVLRQHRGPIDVEEIASNLTTFALLDQAQLLAGVSVPPPALRPHRGFQLEGSPARFVPAEGREAEWARLVYRELLRSTKPAAPGGGRGFGGRWRPVLPGRFGPAQPVQWQVETIGRFQQRPPHPGQNRAGGTGVFLPRVIGNQAAGKKQRDARGREQKQQATKNPAALGQGTPLQPPSASGLPPDWTY